MGFSSVKSSYVAGERGIFCVVLLNLGDTPIRKIDFTLKVRALSFFGYQVLEIQNQSTREFKPNILENIYVEGSLPIATPPGFYALELTAKPEMLNPLPPADIVIYVEMPKNFLGFLSFTSMFSAFYYTLPKISGRIRDVGVETLSLQLRKPAALLLSVDKTIENIEDKFIVTVNNFSMGQNFVLWGVFILMSTAATLVMGMKSVAEQLIILAYFALLIGVANLLWENFTKESLPKSESSFRLRLLVNLAVFTLLMYFSSSLLTIFLVFLTFIAILIMINSAFRK